MFHPWYKQQEDFFNEGSVCLLLVIEEVKFIVYVISNTPSYITVKNLRHCLAYIHTEIFSCIKDICSNPSLQILLNMFSKFSITVRKGFVTVEVTKHEPVVWQAAVWCSCQSRDVYRPLPPWSLSFSSKAKWKQKIQVKDFTRVILYICLLLA